MFRMVLCLVCVATVCSVSWLYGACNFGCKKISHSNSGDSTVNCYYHSPKICFNGYYVEGGDEDDVCDTTAGILDSQYYEASPCTWVCTYDSNHTNVEMNSTNENLNVLAWSRKEGRCRPNGC